MVCTRSLLYFSIRCIPLAWIDHIFRAMDAVDSHKRVSAFCSIGLEFSNLAEAFRVNYSCACTLIEVFRFLAINLNLSDPAWNFEYHLMHIIHFLSETACRSPSPILESIRP